MRMNISVPDSLKARMDAVREDVNWSALACRAFELKLGEIAASKGKKSMKDVVDRLRASKAEAASVAFNNGKQLGEEWAKDIAEAIELERLAKVEDTSDNIAKIVAANGFASQVVWNVVDPHEELPRAEFWENALGDEWEILVDDDDFVLGFVDGAMEVWDAVREEL